MSILVTEIMELLIGVKTLKSSGLEKLNPTPRKNFYLLSDCFGISSTKKAESGMENYHMVEQRLASNTTVTRLYRYSGCLLKLDDLHILSK